MSERSTAAELSQLDEDGFSNRYWLREIAIQLAHLNDMLDVLYDDSLNALRVTSDLNRVRCIQRGSRSEEDEMSERLLPCPFCGGEAIERQTEGHFVECLMCEIGTKFSSSSLLACAGMEPPSHLATRGCCGAD